MADAVGIEVKGLKETQRKVEQVVRDLHGAPMLNAMRDATLLVQRDARKLAPVDTGRLRASITPQVRTRGNNLEGVVGSNVKYAPYMELGTRPHFPPLAALEVWAARHHTTAYAVCRAIARRGTKARRFLQNAFLQNRDRIVLRLNRAVKDIVR